RRQRQAQAGVAGSRFNDGAARLDLTVAFGRFDHAQADAILDRTGGVVAFELGVKLADTGIEIIEADQRRIADQVEDIVIATHKLPSFLSRTLGGGKRWQNRLPAFWAGWMKP